MKGFIIAGTHSGCGKTTITLGILAALKKKGLSIQAFKAGPDFIDSGLHRLITRRPSRNLDIWMCGEEYVKSCFEKNSANADMAIVEGVMGMYDGEFNTARLAQILGLPVILIVDAYGMAESAGAIVKGFATPPTPPLSKGGAGGVAGVIFNRIASGTHYERLKRSVRDVKVLGYLPRDMNFEIPHRHLGLTVAEESPISVENMHRLADAALEHIDIDLIINGNLSCFHSRKGGNPDNGISSSHHLDSCWSLPRTPMRGRNDKAGSLNHSITPVIAVAYDKAFCFYYEDNIDLLKKAGAEIVAFSPLSDTKLPEGTDAIYIGGGYPELAAAELTANSSMRNGILEWAQAGKPLYAECGGLMYLSRGIHDFNGNFFNMAAVFPFETRMKKGRAHLGYREITLKDDCILGKSGEMCRGHEFHYSDVAGQQLNQEMNLVCSLKNNKAEWLYDEGYRFKNALATYTHVHFGSNPAIAENVVNFIKERQWKT